MSLCRHSWPGWSAIALCIGVLLGVLPSQVMAQDHHGRAPLILSPADGATVSDPVSISFGFAAPAPQDGSGAPADGGAAWGGSAQWTPHAFLVIDAPLPDPGTAIRPDAQHIPFPGGQTQMNVTLSPGQHRLQIVLINHEGVVSRHFHPGAAVTVNVR